VLVFNHFVVMILLC